MLSAKRFGIATVTALSITATLLLFMSLLISDYEIPTSKEIVAETINIWRIKVPEDPKPVDRNPPEKETVVPPPVQERVNSKVDIAKFADGPKQIKPVIDDFKITNNQISTIPGPIIKVVPDYPGNARSRGIEGYVIVEYTVASNGSVINPVVVDAKPKGYFEKAALRAIQRFKYNPLIQNNKAVDMPSVRQKFTFQLDK